MDHLFHSLKVIEIKYAISGKIGDKIGEEVEDLTGSDRLGKKAKDKFGDYIGNKKDKVGR